MSNQTGENESRTLSSGEIVYLVKEPGRKWKIRDYEYHQTYTGLALKWSQHLPEDWKDREFDTSDEAANFAQREIQDGKVPGNSQSTL
jgi:hypothetical protein